MQPTATLPSAADAFGSLNGFKRTSSADLLSAAESKYGVGDIQNRVNALKTLTGNLTSSIGAVDPSVTARTSGSLVSEGQRSALVDRERQPLIGQLGTANEGLAGASSDYDKAETNAKSTAAMQADDEDKEYNRLLQVYQSASAKEEAERQAQQAAAEQAEKIREFNAQQSLAERAQATSSANSAAKASAPTKADVASHIVSQFNTNKGRDGYVSNETWANALNDFTAMGGTPRQFFQNYGQYVNPKYKTSYAGWVNR